MAITWNNIRSPRVIIPILIVVSIGLLVNPAYIVKEALFDLQKEESDPLSSFAAGEKMEPNMVVIDYLKIRAPIQFVTERNESAFQKSLINGVVHYPGTAQVGTNGNPFIFGHSSDYIWSKGKYKTVFALLPKIKKGDTIIASDSRGNKFVYRVTEIAVVSPNATKYLDQYEYKKKMLTLQTSYPVGTAFRRFIAVAEMI